MEEKKIVSTHEISWSIKVTCNVIMFCFRMASKEDVITKDEVEGEATEEVGPQGVGDRVMARLGINPNLLMLKVTLFLLYGGKCC